MKRFLKFVEDRQSTIASGLAALLIIVVGFLVFNYFSGLNKTIAPQLTQEATKTAQVTQTQKQTTPASTPQPATLSTATTTLPTTYTVVRGDNLSQIAQNFYGDGNKWTVIAQANNLADPSVIHAGNVLTIPKLEAPAQASSTTSSSSTLSLSSTPKSGANYTVKSGDNLWDIAIVAYGTGYKWYLIDQANGPLPRNVNGKPVIVAGQTLKIP